MSLYWSTPLEVSQVKDQEVIQPEFSITTSKYIHLILNNAWSMELSHRSFTPDDVWYIESKFVNTFFQINENYIR